MKILITGFRPWGLNFFNPSEHFAVSLAKTYKTDLLVMEVSHRGVNKLKKINLKSYDLIFMLGLGDSFRIETKSNDKLESEFARKVRDSLGILKKDNIGDYYCSIAYTICLQKNKNTMFIHMPLIPINKNNYNIDKILVRAIKLSIDDSIKKIINL